MTFAGIKTRMIATALVLLGAINWGLVALFKWNLVAQLRHPLAIQAACVAIAGAGLMLALQRDTYLPFLGPAALPGTLLKGPTPQSGDVPVEISVPSGKGYTRVVFWAASKADTKKKDVIPNVTDAYASFENAGIANITGDSVKVYVHCPTAYTVGGMVSKTLDKHVHYRFVGADGMLSRVHTKTVQC